MSIFKVKRSADPNKNNSKGGYGCGREQGCVKEMAVDGSWTLMECEAILLKYKKMLGQDPVSLTENKRDCHQFFLTVFAKYIEIRTK